MAAVLLVATAVAGIGDRVTHGRVWAAPVQTTSSDARPLRVVLVGDSTVTDDSGWGLGFRQFAGPNLDVVNTAANGRSSKSFIDEGLWNLALARRGDVYVIQFGHNDEPGKGPARETTPATTYTANLRRYVNDVRAAGATPVLVTSLVRRIFDEGTGRIRSTQGAYVEAVRRLAAAERVPLVDLFASSTVLAERLGAAALEPISPRQATGAVDTTHLNASGSLLFGRLVVEDVRRGGPARLAAALRAEPVPSETVRIAAFPDVAVAPDGTGQFTTVQAAIDAAPQTATAARRWSIAIKAGTYRERLYIQREKRFVSLVGEDPARTTIVHNAKASDEGADGRPIGTFRTPTVQIDADDFVVENLAIVNDAGPVGQALALRVDGDRVVFRNSRFLGWQDTILLNRGRQYFEDSFIAGHVDFIFGGATAYFERCHMHLWRDGYITAASTPKESPFGFVFANGIVTGEPEVRAYFGRPWRDYAQVAFLNTNISAVVRPEGWHNWDRPEREGTARYEEFGSQGPGGGGLTGRVKWARRLSASDAAAYSATRVLGGADGWDPIAVPARPSDRRANAGPLPRPPGVAPPAATPATVGWGQILSQPAAWYGGAEALRVADAVRRYQRHTGGWAKDVDMARPLTPADVARLERERAGDDSTIDNGATVTQLRFLSRVAATTAGSGLTAAVLDGVDYLLRAQYPNGGWPQYFPLRDDYSRHVTFNDDAMVGVMRLLAEVAGGRSPFAFVDATRRRRAAAAVERGHRLILAAQIRTGGVLTGWCQQHDAATLRPASARTYEHPSVSGSETVGIVRYLMSVERPDRDTVAAIEAAVAWLRSTTVRGLRLERRPEATSPSGYDVVVVEDAAAPLLWARFYEIGTNRPIYSGRDGVIKTRLADIEVERRAGYSWLGPYATTLLSEDLPAWQRRLGRVPATR